MKKCVIYDPTVHDAQSKVRGIGRYFQLIKENAPPHVKYESNLRKFAEESVDVFFNPFFNILATPKRYIRIAKKQIAVLHDIIPLLYPKHFPLGIKGKMNTWLTKRALKRHYDLIVTDSETSKKSIVEHLRIDGNKIKVLYPALTNAFSNPKSEIRNSKFIDHLKLDIGNYLLYVGDATWNKNLINLAKAVKTAKIPCVFVGKVFQNIKNEGKEAFFESQLSEQPRSEMRVDLEKKILSRNNNPWLNELHAFTELAHNDPLFIFPGYISDSDLMSLYKNALANILVSRDEGFGFSYLEAASQKCPSILSDTPIFHEIAKDAALFVETENPKNISEAIATMKTDSSARLNLITKSQKRLAFFQNNTFKKELQALLS